MKKSLRLILSVMAITILSQGSLLAWSEPTQITTTGGRSGPCLVQDSTGEYWVAFSYSGDVHISSSLDGIVWSTPTNITNWGNCSWSSLIQDFDGVYRLAFGAGSAEPYKIYVMSSSDGLSWSSPVQVPTIGTSFEPCIIQDSNGKYWLTYNTYSGIYITNSDDFVNWSSSTTIVSGFMAGSWLIQDSAGKYWVAYYYHGGNWPVYITNSSNGTVWDSPTQVVSGQDDGYYSGRNPELIQDSAGTYWMTYGTVDQVGKHDVALISSSDGVSWSSPFIVAGGDSDDGYTSSIIHDQSGAYWVAFPSDRSGDWNIWISSSTAQEIGLFAYWKFDEGSGFIAGDSSGNGKDGIIDGATWTTGKIGDALSFDGFDDWVDVPDDISTKHITLEAWIYPTGFDDGPGDQGNAIIQRSTGGAGAPGDRSWSWRLRITPRSHLAQFQAAGPNTGVGSVVAPTALVQNRWYHLAATYDGNVMKIYVDGEVKATNSNLDGPLETYHLIPVAIGCLEGWGLQHFQGIIDEVRVYGRALTAEEFAEHAECGPGEICGVVTDSVTGEPVEGATVLIMNRAGQFKKHTRTGADGSYILSCSDILSEGLFPWYLKVLAEGYGYETHMLALPEVQAGLNAGFELTPANILHVPYYHQGHAKWCGPTSLSMALKYGNLNFKPWEIAATYSLGVKDGFGSWLWYDPTIDFCVNEAGVSCLKQSWQGESTDNMLGYFRDAIGRRNPVKLGMGSPVEHAVVVVGFDSNDNLYINDPEGYLFRGEHGLYPSPPLPSGVGLVRERVSWYDLHQLIENVQCITYEPNLSKAASSGISCYVRNNEKLDWSDQATQYSTQLLLQHIRSSNNKLALRLDGNSKLGYQYYNIAGNHPELLHSSLRYAALPDDSLSFSPYICNAFPYQVDELNCILWIGQILPSGEELLAKDFGLRTMPLHPHCSPEDDQKTLLAKNVGEFGDFLLSSLEAGFDYCLHLEVFLSSEFVEPVDELSIRFHLLDQVVVSPEGATVALPDGDTDPQNDTRIEIPAGALQDDTVISITKVDAAPVADFTVGLSPVNPIAAYEVAARNEEGEEILVNFLTSATLYLAYPDADDDGYVDGISPPLLESWLNVWSWDPVLYQWAYIPSDVDEVNNVVWLYTNHLSTYSLFPNTIAIKNSAIDELEGAKIGDKIDKDIDDAIKHIKKSLDKKQDFWIDDSHLDPKHGKKVFDEEKKAAKILMQLMDNKDVPEAVKDACLIAIAKLIEADDILASTIYDEALDVAGDPKVDKELEKCEKEFEKVDEELAKENYDKAIDHYKKAWEHAQKALKKLW